ncbi:uncharacterized protein LOC135961491 [Calliphora vicina]|uniref:uncharacterized protein LOC135961491 n=1 Tax=Calliphora vicina TaxID=7373 RepID=UPI00325BA828
MDVSTKRSADIDSDHELVITSIRIELSRNYKQGSYQSVRKRFDVNKLADEGKRSEMANAMRVRLLTNNHGSWEETCAEINSFAEETLGYVNNCSRKIWECTQQYLADNRLKPQYRTIAKEVKRSARVDKRKYYENLAGEAEDTAGANNMRHLYPIISRLSEQNFNHNNAVRDCIGQLLTTVEQQTRRWKEHFENISNITITKEENNANMYQTGILTEAININPPSLDEIMNAITSLKRNKSPGEDGISAEILQVDPMASAEIMHPYITEAWQSERFPNEWLKGTIVILPKKGDLSDCNNWRGITLLNAIYKVMATIVNSRLKPVEQGLRDKQAGFRSHRSCVDQANTLRIIIEQSVELRSPLYLVFIVFQKAFDTIKRNAIWTALRNKGVPTKVINIIK